MMTQYRGVPLGELSPHVYAIAEQVRGARSILFPAFIALLPCSCVPLVGFERDPEGGTG